MYHQTFCASFSLPSFCSRLIRKTSFEKPASGYLLYVALYARGGKSTMPGHEDRYHWAFIVEPEDETKNSQRKRFHVKKLVELAAEQRTANYYWHFEEIDISTNAPSMMLTRILIGKVKDLDRFRSSLRRTPIQQEVKAWNWIDWTEAAFYEMTQDNGNLETCVTNWETLRDTVMRYIELKKLSHRFDGTRAYDFTKVPTWDMLQGAKVVP